MTAHLVRRTIRGMLARMVVGCMTGTSLDGLDAALVRVNGRGLAMRVRLIATAGEPLGRLSAPLRALAGGEPLSAACIAKLNADLTEAHIAAIRRLCGRRRPDLIAVHGQTVFHAPPLSWQLINPTPIAHAFGAPLVCDLRAADLAAGGQGAPITPLADYVLFRSPHERRAIVNLGGFCNVTFLPRATAGRTRSPVVVRASRSDAPPAGIRGGDVCVCNQLLDAIARRCFRSPFDRDGQYALTGTVQRVARNDLLKRLTRQSTADRSLGSGDELADWLGRHAPAVSGADLARSACDAIAAVIVGSITRVRRVVLAGGGTRNRALVDAIRVHAKPPVSLSDDLGVPAAAREAAAIAVLGALCADGVPITLSAVTGCRRPPVAGVWVMRSGPAT